MKQTHKIDATQFNDLPLQRRLEYTWDNGYFVDEELGGRFLMKIFAVDDFWVKMYCDLGTCTLVHARAIEMEAEWDEFLKPIKLWEYL